MSFQALLLMAGEGSRFQGVSDLPKPYIQVLDKPMYKWAEKALKNLSPDMSLFYLAQEKHRALIPNASENLIFLPELTRGPVETAMKALPYLDLNKPLAIMDCDLYFEARHFQTIFKNQKNFDGVLFSFRSQSDRYSYVRTSADKLALSVKEKEVISDRAIAGCYYFATAGLFVEAAQKVLTSFSGKEIYLSSVIAELLTRKKNFLVLDCDQYFSFGTPEELSHSLELLQSQITK